MDCASCRSMQQMKHYSSFVRHLYVIEPNKTMSRYIGAWFFSAQLKQPQILKGLVREEEFSAIYCWETLVHEHDTSLRCYWRGSNRMEARVTEAVSGAPFFA